jgi:3-phenylpropionate/trans-cinnamate dioxygenase ferredoxin subunit
MGNQTNLSDYTFYAVAKVNELPEGERLFLEIDGEPIVMLNIAGRLYAIGDVCSHDDGPVGEGEIDGCEIICPRHGARFDIRSGAATRLPAVVGIPTYPVRISEDDIEIGVPNR